MGFLRGVFFPSPSRLKKDGFSNYANELDKIDFL